MELVAQLMTRVCSPSSVEFDSFFHLLLHCQQDSWPRVLLLSGPIRANRFSLQKKTLQIDLPKNGIAARTGRESREFQGESERRRDSSESGQVLQK